MPLAQVNAYRTAETIAAPDEWLCHEYARLTAALARSQRELETKTRQFESIIDRLEEEAHTDPLTGLGNRRRLTTELTRVWRTAAPRLACVMIDLDGFKTLNDRAGHPRGDEILGMVGGVLRANLRTGDVAARFGGDEFCLLLPEITPEEAEAVAHRVAAVFDEAVERTGRDEPKVGMTLGLAHAAHNVVEDGAALLALADAALYEGKSGGKGRLVVRGGCLVGA